ncbi:uncharacterized protein FOMMEDRAFT_169557 [Fomitiporia mediterranea MF3/22]|uniref:uncharacterized protein n=1 Tax=Fomitiporia mediterranea (strain MF3/22) TaxID=694068 RepID=UPI00044078FF|nr:uncharacterized protein FOMMEDRAFT_169557 [Fomitiporia mediterranea MF3/22]EJD01435.1 hypothetical protein FOMMEDRAFT_169557 [Fomitiporia mediterranea MF3/22]
MLVEFSSSNRTRSGSKSTIKPLVGLLAFSVLLGTACALPPYILLRRRLVRLEAELSKLNASAIGTGLVRARTAEVLREVKALSVQVDAVKAQVDRMGGDVKDMRSIGLKERTRLAGVETRFDSLSEQLKLYEQRVLAALAAEQKRNSKTDEEINGLRKTADKNANNLSKVAVSLADIADFIDRSEIEQGVLPEQGKESSKHVNALRDSALRVLESMHKAN